MPSVARIHVLPLSTETSTPVISASPVQANPVIGIKPVRSIPPSIGEVIIDLTTSPVSGAISLGSTAAPGAMRRTGYSTGLHEEPVVLATAGLKVCEPLDRVRTLPARHDSPQRKTMLNGQRHSIHLERQDRVGIQRLLDWQLPDEVGHRSHRHVGAIQPDVPGRCLDPGALQHVSQTDASPTRIPDGAPFPLHAGDGRIEESPAIARTLERHGQRRARHLPEVIEGQRERAIDVALDREPPVIGPNRWRVQVRPDVEQLVGRDPRVEQGDRGFQVLRARRPHEETILADRRRRELLHNAGVAERPRSERGRGPSEADPPRTFQKDSSIHDVHRSHG